MRRYISLILLSSLAVAAVDVASVHASVTAKPNGIRVILPKGAPKYLQISKLRVTAKIESTALSKASDVHAPYKWEDVAWYNRGPRPGEPGRASLFGHLDSTCCPAVFYHLQSLKPGDTFQVMYKTGIPLTFKVMWSASYPNNRLPVNFLFAAVQERGVSLVTCTGAFHRDGTGYDHKRVVYGRLLLPDGKLG